MQRKKSLHQKCNYTEVNNLYQILCMPNFVTVAIIHLTLVLRTPNRPETEISLEKKTTAAALNYVKNFVYCCMFLFLGSKSSFLIGRLLRVDI